MTQCPVKIPPQQLPACWVVRTIKITTRVIWLNLTWLGLVWFGLVWFHMDFATLCCGFAHKQLVTYHISLLFNVLWPNALILGFIRLLTVCLFACAQLMAWMKSSESYEMRRRKRWELRVCVLCVLSCVEACLDYYYTTTLATIRHVIEWNELSTTGFGGENVFVTVTISWWKQLSERRTTR